MNMTDESGMIYRPQPPVFRQIAAFLFGLVFAFTGGYSGLQLVGAAVCAPLLFAGAVRLYTAVYRVVRRFVAGCGLGALLSAAVAFSAIGAVLSFMLMPAFRFSTALGVIFTVVLMFCELFQRLPDLEEYKRKQPIRKKGSTVLQSLTPSLWFRRDIAP